MFPGGFMRFLLLLVEQGFYNQTHFHCSLTEAKPEQTILVSSGI